MELTYYGFIYNKIYTDGTLYLDFTEDLLKLDTNLVLTTKNKDIQEEIECLGELDGKCICVVVVGTPYIKAGMENSGFRYLKIFTIKKVEVI